MNEEIMDDGNYEMIKTEPLAFEEYEPLTKNPSIDAANETVSMAKEMVIDGMKCEVVSTTREYQIQNG